VLRALGLSDAAPENAAAVGEPKVDGNIVALAVALLQEAILQSTSEQNLPGGESGIAVETDAVQGMPPSPSPNRTNRGDAAADHSHRPAT